MLGNGCKLKYVYMIVCEGKVKRLRPNRCYRVRVIVSL